MDCTRLSFSAVKLLRNFCRSYRATLNVIISLDLKYFRSASCTRRKHHEVPALYDMCQLTIKEIHHQVTRMALLGVLR